MQAFPLHCSLDFFPTSTRPLLEGDYVIYNKCDGYHIVEGVEIDGKIVFQDWGGEIKDDFYVAWARLPTTELMYERFAKQGREG